MPSWVDLSEHEAALNVTQTPDGKRLILRPIAATAVIPDSVKSMGFVARDGAFERTNLKFSLSEIQAHFPRAKSREIALADIFYVPQLPSSINGDRIAFTTVIERETKDTQTIDMFEGKKEALNA